jgi:hypothetical protein
MDRILDQARSWVAADGFNCLVVTLLSIASVHGIDVTISSGNSTIVVAINNHLVDLFVREITLQQVAAVSPKLI